MDDEIGGNEGSRERLRLRMLDVTEASFKTFFDPLPKPHFQKGWPTRPLGCGLSVSCSLTQARQTHPLLLVI